MEQGNNNTTSDLKMQGHTLLAKCHPNCNERSLFLRYCQLSDCFVEQTSEVREGGGERTASTLPTVACLLSFDLLPQVSWRMDEQKGQCGGSAQSAPPTPFLFGFHILPLMYLKTNNEGNCERYQCIQ